MGRQRLDAADAGVIEGRYQRPTGKIIAPQQFDESLLDPGIGDLVILDLDIECAVPALQYCQYLLE